MQRYLLFAIALLTPLSPGLARAEECGPLKPITRVQMEAVGDKDAFLVPVTINGSPRKLLLDTGGYISQLSRATVDSLKLEDHPSILEMYDVTGDKAARFVRVQELVLGTLHAANLEMPVFPDPVFGAAGILSSNLLIAYDVDIDYGTGIMTYFSPDHCPGKVLYWSAPVATAVPMTIRDKSTIVIPVTVDGHQFKAVIDTGASQTSMSLPVAKRVFGLTPESPGVIARRGVNNDKDLPYYQYVFHSLTFGDISVTNAHIDLVPDVMNRNGDKTEQTANRALLNNADITLSELLIGMNLLKRLHIYMAFRERMLYITPASTPASPASGTDAQAAPPAPH